MYAWNIYVYVYMYIHHTVLLLSWSTWQDEVNF